MYIEKDSTIEFTWSITDIFRDASMRSTFAARNIMAAQAPEIDSIDVYAIGDDEYDFVVVMLQKAIGELFDMFAPHTMFVADSLQANKESVGIKVTRHLNQTGEGNYNPNTLKQLDGECAEYLAHYVLCRWWESVKSSDDLAIVGSQLTNSIIKIRNYTYDISTPAYVCSCQIITEP